MRIGLVTASYPRSPGDPAGGFVADHARWLARAGHEVEVLAAASSPGDRDVDPRESIRIRRIPAGDGLFYGGGAPEALAASPRAHLVAARFSIDLTREVARRAGSWDAVVAHWLVPGGLAALLAARQRPLLAIAHSGDVHLLRRLHARRAFAALCHARVRLSFVTEELRRLFLLPGARLDTQVCPMGIEVARFRAARARILATGSRPPTVLFLGRLVPVKGVEVLLRAAAGWRSGARLVVAGAGPSEPALRRLAAALLPDRVLFTGELRGDARDDALAASTIVALPSIRVEGGRTEGMPVVALEAMASGAALVASGLGGLGELPPDAVTTVPPGNASALASAIDSLVLDDRRRVAQCAVQDRLVDRFDWSEIGPRLLPP